MIPARCGGATRITDSRCRTGAADQGLGRDLGWAWAAAGVALGPGQHRRRTQLVSGEAQDRRQWSWQRFAFDWRPGATASFTLAARATDARDPMCKGRIAVHTVRVAIE
jgi:hypothetical protein